MIVLHKLNHLSNMVSAIPIFGCTMVYRKIVTRVWLASNYMLLHCKQIFWPVRLGRVPGTNNGKQWPTVVNFWEIPTGIQWTQANVRMLQSCSVPIKRLKQQECSAEAHMRTLDWTQICLADGTEFPASGLGWSVKKLLGTSYGSGCRKTEATRCSANLAANSCDCSQNRIIYIYIYKGPFVLILYMISTYLDHSACR